MASQVAQPPGWSSHMVACYCAFRMGSGKGAQESRQAWGSFDEAATVFADPLAITIHDPDHSQEEERFLTTGMSKRHRLVIVAHTDREGRVRIITAREVTPTERTHYESGE
jgi:hypothetical protein